MPPRVVVPIVFIAFLAGFFGACVVADSFWATAYETTGVVKSAGIDSRTPKANVQLKDGATVLAVTSIVGHPLTPGDGVRLLATRHAIGFTTYVVLHVDAVSSSRGQGADSR